MMRVRLRLKTKHIPQRTCVACRQSREKKDLVRLVRSKDGLVEVDPSARRPGRGAYLCARSDCWELGLKGNRLEHALRTKFTPDDRQALMSYADKLPKGD
jgi:predicted RNA-binding protein YlxR (DUF448 family)